MGDEDHRHPQLVLQAPHELEDLGLGGDIERGRRLVGNQQGCGSSESAMAIIARWRIPPLNW